MKKHSFLIEILIFCSILLMLVIPPIFSSFFTTEDSSLGFDSFPFIQFVYCIFAIVLYFFYCDEFFPVKNFTQFCFNIIFPMTITFCLLFGVSLISTFVSKILPSQIIPIFVRQVQVIKPNNFIGYFYSFINFFFAAIYEEIIFRFYIGDALLGFISKKSTKKFWSFFAQFVALILFAFGHFYLGLLAVINSAVAHLILRKCYSKSKNIYSCIAAHFIYNLLVFILL